MQRFKKNELMTFVPALVGGLPLKNRIVFAPFETNYATEEGFPTERQIAYYERMAAGGLGLLIVEATNVNPEPDAKGTRFGLSLSDDRFQDPFCRMIERIHNHGAKAALQIVDKSLKARKKNPADMTEEELDRLPLYFADCAARCRQVGFDAVEFHMAHSYTVGDFLSKRGNNRQDSYGGGVEGRTKLARSIIQKTREKVGKDYPLICRINGDEFITGGNTLKDGVEIAARLAEAGASLIDVSVGVRRDDGSGTYSIIRGIPPADFADGCNIHVAQAIKKAVHIPVITVGKIWRLEMIEETLQTGRADLVALARSLFADPDLPRKYQEGRGHEVTRCLWCNYCHRTYISDKVVECVQRLTKRNKNS